MADMLDDPDSPLTGMHSSVAALHSCLPFMEIDIMLYRKHDLPIVDLEVCGANMSKTNPDETVQIKVSAKTKKEIRRVALERDETLRTFVLRALRDRGVAVSDEEVGDRRKSVLR